ncbi:MAG: HEPN domain-containing protein [Pseudomonadota bacterium]
MSYKELVAKNLIRPFKAKDPQIKKQMELAHRDLKVARAMIGVNNDWTYSIAYNAILQAVRALMYMEGFRPVGEGQHKTAILFTELALGEKYEDEVYFFDKMRTKRNQAVYDTAGIVSEDEAKQSIMFAEKFVGRIEEVLKGLR